MKVIDLRFWKARKDIEANEPVELYDLRRKGADDEAARKKLKDYLALTRAIYDRRPR